MKFFYATQNPGKFNEIAEFARYYPVEIVGPTTLNIELPNVPEDADNYEDNARQKFEAAVTVAPKDVIIVADDGGIEIDALGGEPGIHTRRWRDHKTRMTDDEIIDYALERLEDAPSRQAHFVSTLAYGRPGEEPKFVSSRVSGEILTKPRPQRVEGYPFRALFYMPEFGKMLDELHDLPLEDRPGFRFLTHREGAWHKLFERLGIQQPHGISHPHPKR